MSEIHTRIYLEQELKYSIETAKQKLAKEEKALALLSTTNLQNADYNVHLHSLWTNDGEQDVTISHKGSLEEAIKIAEKEFMAVNKRVDVQALYLIGLQLGESNQLVPECFWQQYKMK